MSTTIHDDRSTLPHLTDGQSSQACLDAGLVCSIDTATGRCTECDAAATSMNSPEQPVTPTINVTPERVLAEHRFDSNAFDHRVTTPRRWYSDCLCGWEADPLAEHPSMELAEALLLHAAHVVDELRDEGFAVLPVPEPLVPASR